MHNDKHTGTLTKSSEDFEAVSIIRITFIWHCYDVTIPRCEGMNNLPEPSNQLHLGTPPSTLLLYFNGENGAQHFQTHKLPGRWEGSVGMQDSARVVRSERQLCTPQQHPLHPTWQTVLSCLPSPRGICSPPGSCLDRTHFKGQPASTERSSIKLVQRIKVCSTFSGHIKHMDKSQLIQ